MAARARFDSRRELDLKPYRIRIQAGRYKSFAPHPRLSDRSSPESASGVYPGMAHKILVVEDNPDCREMLVLLFQHEGYSVVAARDGREGLRLAREESPELIITDLHMPHLSGVELIAELRGLGGFNKTPILAMTAYDTSEECRAIEAGASFAVMKPVSIEDLFDHVARLLRPDGC